MHGELSSCSGRLADHERTCGGETAADAHSLRAGVPAVTWLSLEKLQAVHQPLRRWSARRLRRGQLKSKILKEGEDPPSDLPLLFHLLLFTFYLSISAPFASSVHLLTSPSPGVLNNVTVARGVVSGWPNRLGERNGLSERSRTVPHCQEVAGRNAGALSSSDPFQRPSRAAYSILHPPFEAQ